LSAFLGIGGGPINIAVLFILFSMSSKEAVLNSLFIILCSQTTSLLSYFATNTVPQINPVVLTLMCIGGICGALIGRGLSKKMSNKSIDKLFGVVTFCLVLLNIFNIVKFGGAF
ncbi:MAG: sulfite exporter TauE/SafE family protein, partial [Oscillospiraceae bacterium]